MPARLTVLVPAVPPPRRQAISDITENEFGDKFIVPS